MTEGETPSPEGRPVRIDPPKQEVTPYALEPDTPAPPGAASRPPTPPRPGKLGDRSFMDDMPEDTDLEHDPEVERALKGAPPSSDKSVDADADKPTFVRPGGGGAKPIALIGAGLAIGAAITAGVRSSDHWFASAALALYLTAFHTGTGVAAAAAVAYLERVKFGAADLMAARMLVAVAIAYLVFSAGMGGYNALTAPLGAVLYLLALGVLSRFTPVRLLRVAAVHVLLVAGVYVAMMLYAAARAPVATP